MQIIFREDFGRDIHNWNSSITATTYGVDWKRFLPRSVPEEKCRDEKFLREYLELEFYRNGRVADFIAWMIRHTNSAQVTDDVEVLLDRTAPAAQVTAFITTYNRAPYNAEGRFFYLIQRDSGRERSLTNVYHEVMHLMFHWHYWKICRDAGLSDSQIHVLKESLTVLLDPLLRRRGLPCDIGYAGHRQLRSKWTRMWTPDQRFEAFLQEVLPGLVADGDLLKGSGEVKNGAQP